MASKQVLTCMQCNPPCTVNEDVAVICVSCDKGKIVEIVDGEVRFIEGKEKEAAKYVRDMGCIMFKGHSDHTYIRYSELKVRNAYSELKRNTQPKIREAFGTENKIQKDTTISGELRAAIVQETIGALEAVGKMADFEKVLSQIRDIVNDAKEEQERLKETMTDYAASMQALEERLRKSGLGDEKFSVLNDDYDVVSTSA